MGPGGLWTPQLLALQRAPCALCASFPCQAEPLPPSLPRQPLGAPLLPQESCLLPGGQSRGPTAARKPLAHLGSAASTEAQRPLNGWKGKLMERIFRIPGLERRSSMRQVKKTPSRALDSGHGLAPPLLSTQPPTPPLGLAPHSPPPGVPPPVPTPHPSCFHQLRRGRGGAPPPTGGLI